jgi:putative phage-type endonuclease
MEQRSPEWFAARLGKVTASRVAELMATTKSGYSASRANYMAELICERLTGSTAERYSNAAMQWGTDNEGAAKEAYAFIANATVEDIGFCQHPSIADFGASPDGLIGSDGLIEVKCPNTATHIETLLTDGIEGKYHTQMQVQMACTSRGWCDFVSFDPRLPVEMTLWVKRVERNAARITEIESEVRKFLTEMEGKISALNSRYAIVPQ